jgi:L-ascorbate metabolism protein UlaG (beta-lactamase superfamily)
MVITYQGENYFRIQSGDTIVLIDPGNQRSFKGATLALHTLRPTLTEAPSGEEGGQPTPFWIDHQGEYDVQGVSVRGWTTGWVRDEEHTAYRIVIDDISVVVLGYLTQELSAEVQGELVGADIVIAPAGGKPFIAVPAAAKLVRQIEPSIILPSLATDLKAFTKELGAGKIEPEEKLTVKKKDLAPKAMKLVVLSS